MLLLLISAGVGLLLVINNQHGKKNSLFYFVFKIYICVSKKKLRRYMAKVVQALLIAKVV
jgi:hypothetical protein